MASHDATQGPSNLPKVTRFITSHDHASGKAILHSTDSAKWTPLAKDTMGFNVVYTTSEFPPSFTDDKDIYAHEKVISSGNLGLVNPHGTVCRMVDFGPGHTPLMHRTQSLDYGIVLEGTVEMHLDGGEMVVLKRGDVAVQRATMHAWKNASETEWARMIFVLQDCQSVEVGGKRLKEDLSADGGRELPPSGNDE